MVERAFQENMEPERRRAMRAASSGSIMEGVVGAGAATLAILALAGVLPVILVPVAVLAGGAALIFQGLAVTTRLHAIMNLTSDERHPAGGALGEGLTVELMGGAGAAVLGLLAVIGVGQTILPPIGVIILGATLLTSTNVIAKLNHLAISYSGHHEAAQEVAREAVQASLGAQILLGLGAMALGILAIVGVAPMALTMIGVLAVGASVLLSGTALGTRMVSTLSQ